jgi:hypothetical protein
MWGSAINAVYTNTADIRQQLRKNIQDATHEIHTAEMSERAYKCSCPWRTFKAFVVSCNKNPPSVKKFAF